MLLWYLGGTVAVVRYAFRDERMDLRLLLLGAVLPDLIDKPIAAFAFGATGSTRLAGHSLLFAGILMVGVLLGTRRGRPRKLWMPLAIGTLVHLFLAFMWTDPETLWWPFLGFEFTADAATSFRAALATELRSPLTWILEAVGAGYLVYLSARARLYRPAARRVFIATGRIDVPIDRAR